MTTTSYTPPDHVVKAMARTSLEQAGFPPPATAEQQKRDKAVAAAIRAPIQELLGADSAITDELQELDRIFDAAMERRSEIALEALTLPNWRFRFPPYHYGVADNGLAQVKQASAADGRLFVNSLSGNIASGHPGRVTGLTTVGIEVTGESLDNTEPTSRPVSAKAYVDWGAAWNIAVSGFAPFGDNPWGEVRVRLNLLVFNDAGTMVATSYPQEIVTEHRDDAPGSSIREWSGQPAGDISLFTVQDFFLPLGQRHWVNLDLYVEANSGETSFSRASATCMTAVTVSKFRFWLL